MSKHISNTKCSSKYEISTVSAGLHSNTAGCDTFSTPFSVLSMAFKSSIRPLSNVPTPQLNDPCIHKQSTNSLKLDPWATNPQSVSKSPWISTFRFSFQTYRRRLPFKPTLRFVAQVFASERSIPFSFPFNLLSHCIIFCSLFGKFSTAFDGFNQAKSPHVCEQSSISPKSDTWADFPHFIVVCQEIQRLASHLYYMLLNTAFRELQDYSYLLSNIYNRTMLNHSMGLVLLCQGATGLMVIVNRVILLQIRSSR